MGIKQTQNLNNVESEIDIRVKIADLNGVVNLVSQQVVDLSKNVFMAIDGLKAQLEALKTQIEKQMLVSDRFVTQEEFRSHLKEVQPVIEWANDRRAVEKFLIAFISLMGIGNIILIIKIIFFS